MTKEEVIRLAKEAGFDEHHATFDTRIEAFAKLVAEQEREACAKVCEDEAFVEQWKGLAEAAKRIRAREQA